MSSPSAQTQIPPQYPPIENFLAMVLNHTRVLLCRKLSLTMQLPQHCTFISKYRFPYTIVPASHERKQLQKVNTIHTKAKCFPSRIPS